MAQKAEAPEYLKIPYTVSVPCKFSAGRYMGKMFLGLKNDKKIWANKCPKCGRIMFPPRAFCGSCHGVEAGEWVELSDKGTLKAFDVVYYPFVDPTTGETLPIPWAHGLIMLDGGGTMDHFLSVTDPEKLKEGMRFQAVWREEGRIGEMTDIIHFKPIEE